MNRKKILISIGAVAAVIAIYFVYQHLMYIETDNAQIEGNTVMLAAKVGGYVRKVNVVDGQKVKEGEVLVELDDRDQQNTSKQLKAELDSRQARRQEAERTFGRMSTLFKSGAIARAQFDQAQAAYNEVRGQYDALQAQVAQSELNLAYTKVIAPLTGFVARKSVEVGQLVAPGTPLMGFVGATERWVTANFKETDIGAIKLGSRVDVEVDAINSKSFQGTVMTIDPATGATFTLLPPDNATGNFTKVVQRVPVRIRLDGLTDQDIEVLRAGLSAVVKIHKGR